MIAVVMAIDVYPNRSKLVNSCYGNIQPISLVIRSQGETRALDMQANEIPIEEHCSNVPELAGFLAQKFAEAP